MVNNDCTTSSIAPYVPSPETPWDYGRAKHFFRRIGFSESSPNIEQALLKQPGILVDEVVDAAVNLALTPNPPFYDWGYSTYVDMGLDDERIFSDGTTVRMGFLEDMVKLGLREKLVLFWSSHFVTLYDSYFCSSTLFRYYNLLQRNALGNFKTFVSEIGLSPAMLIFLNGANNNKFEPNENYARELFELFTLGESNNYTQDDIEETSKALTGYIVEDCLHVQFVAEFFSNDTKTIFGQTGNWNYNDIINILFDQRAEEISKFVCGKIYQFFVSDEINQDAVDQLAQTFRDNNFELVPVYKQLFKSAIFFDSKVMGVKIKSPVEMCLSFFNEFSIPIDEERLSYIFWFSAQVGQELFNPPDVAGWKGNRRWIDSSTMVSRWEMIDNLSWYLLDAHPEILRQLAIDVSSNSSDPEIVVTALVDYFLTGGFKDESAYENAQIVFRADIPQNYFDDNLWNLSWDSAPYQVTLLIQYLGRQPEFQTN